MSRHDLTELALRLLGRGSSIFKYSFLCCIGLRVCRLSHDYFMKLKQQERLTKKEDRETQVLELIGQTLEVETEKIEHIMNLIRQHTETWKEIVESTCMNAREL